MNAYQKSNHIKLAEENDLKVILALQRETFALVAMQMNNFDIPPLLQTFEDIYKEYNTGVILKYMSENGQIVGSVRGYIDGYNICHVGKLIVHPDYQNRGIGKELMYEIEKYFPCCRKFSLFTGEVTPNTLHLYSKVGYHIICKQVMDNVNMIVMEKEKLIHRSLIPSDLNAICKLPSNEEELFFMFPKANYPLTVEQLKDTLKVRFEPTVILWDNEIVGFANFYEVKEGQYCSIGNVVVNSRYRNRGFGTFLITVMETIAKTKYNVSEIHLSCFNANMNGLFMYSKLGYKPYKIEKYIKNENEISALIEFKKVL